MKQHPVSIVIPAFNEAELTRQCIASILANTAYPYRVVLVDNGSDPPLATDYEDVSNVTVLRSESNVGFAAGVNLGIAQAEGHVLLLNNDTLVPEGWLVRMASVLHRFGDIGAVGPMSNSVSGSQLIPDLELSSLDEINRYAAERQREHSDDIRDVARLVGFCMLIREEVVEEVGLFDEQFGTGNFEDDDYCVRILRAGYRLCVDEGSFVFHYGSQTFQAMGMVGDGWDSLIADNTARFDAKWNLRPEDRLDSFQASLQRNREAGALFEQGDVAGAIRAYVEAIALEPHFGRNHNDLAVVLWQHGETKKAYARVKQAVILDPDNDDARVNLAEMANVLGCRDDAKKFLDELDREA